MCYVLLISGITDGVGVGVGGRAECLFDAFHQEIFADQPGKREARETNRKKENCKREGGNSKCKGKKSIKMSRGIFFFFFFFAIYFLKPLKFVWDLPKWKFLLGKSISCRREKNREKCFCPPWKYSSYATAPHLEVKCDQGKWLLCIWGYPLAVGNREKIGKSDFAPLENIPRTPLLLILRWNVIKVNDYSVSGDTLWL